MRYAPLRLKRVSNQEELYMAEIKVSAEKLRTLETAIFEKKGFSKEGAEMVANSLVEADLRGVSSHGAIRVPVYLSRLDHNVVFPDKEFDVCVDNGAMAIVDGHDSFGKDRRCKGCS